MKTGPVPRPPCVATKTVAQPRHAALGSRTCRRGHCRRIGNARIGTPDDHVPYPTDRVVLVVPWRSRDTRSLRDLAALFLARGCAFSHGTVRDRAARFAPLVADPLRTTRRGRGGTKWHADETAVRGNGAWCSQDRAIDRAGNLVEALLRETRDLAAARRCFARARDIAGHAPGQVTTDGHDASPRASRETRGPGVGIVRLTGSGRCAGAQGRGESWEACCSGPRRGAGDRPPGGEAFGAGFAVDGRG